LAHEVEYVLRGIVPLPDVTTLSWFQSLYKSQVIEPERRLLLAILEDAIKVVKDGPQNNRKAVPYRETVDWFLDDNPDWPFSFIYICDAFDIPASNIRKKLNLHGAKTYHPPKVGRPKKTPAASSGPDLG